MKTNHVLIFLKTTHFHIDLCCHDMEYDANLLVEEIYMFSSIPGYFFIDRVFSENSKQSLIWPIYPQIPHLQHLAH